MTKNKSKEQKKKQTPKNKSKEQKIKSRNQ